MKTLIVSCLYFISLTIYPQKLAINELKDLDAIAVAVLSDEYFNYYKKIDKENSEDRIIYLIDENFESIDIENIESSMILRSINIYDRKSKKILKEGINVWKLNQVLNGDMITISVGYFWLEYKRQKYHFINKGGSNVYFKFSCKKRIWELYKIKHNG